MKIENHAKIRLPNFSARVMRQALRAVGEDCGRWAAGAGLNVATLDDPAGSVTGGQEMDLQVGFACATRHVPGLGFRLGQQYGLLGYGQLGAAALTADTFGVGLQTLQAFGALTFSLFGFPVVAADGDDLSVVIVGDEQIPALCRDFCQERVLSATVRVLTDMHPRLRPVIRVETRLNLTEDRSRWEGELGIPIVFGAATTRIVLRENVSRAPLPMADDLLSPMFSIACENSIREAELIDNTLGRLYRLLIQSGAPYPGAATASRMLGLSERTFHRRLAEQGRAFGEVLQSVRRQRATALLSTTDLSIDQIATLIGFSEPASFSRAYKQWTGLRPVSVREAQRASPRPRP